MPKSKRDKKVSLTKVTKKGVQVKQKLIEEIRNSTATYKRIFLFSVHNMRNNTLKVLRDKWKDSRFFFGKNKVMMLGLGRKKEEEIGDNLHKLAMLLKGQCGLLFTNRAVTEVIEFFENFTSVDYAKTGFKPSETIILKKGPLPDFSHAIEPHLRSLGMPTTLEKGVIYLTTDFNVCKKDKLLTSEQARLLKHLVRPLAEFRLNVICYWTKNGQFTSLQKIDAKKFEKEDKDVEMDEI